MVFLKNSETDGTLKIPVECCGTKEFRVANECDFGKVECENCDNLVWLGMGDVTPQPVEA